MTPRDPVDARSRAIREEALRIWIRQDPIQLLTTKCLIRKWAS
ncbi:hypothetical protein [Streptomyces sp. VNUA24]|nr:hypothetical protein [Streptomyces sp. VNUA24]WEH12911.1 hypothetical protein PYR72_04010 [Streptomyces sp. VNUA24]